ncbi:hypothetical protein B0T21DRAFT_280503 [Apiosordaria backusii]|uniref:Uncharacterized protein n=1 Tax=Apiosordaria backusii TaxID=314023 RepID=A0AA40ES80_9PEZI|nr:hypothetical protein B0T21DRAFT_280503 [Apiosordaria backusii]
MSLVYPIMTLVCHDLVASRTSVFSVFEPVREARDTGETDAEQTAENTRDSVRMDSVESTYTCIVDPSFRTLIFHVCRQNGH